MILGNDQTSSRLPAFSLSLPGSCPNHRHRRTAVAAFTQLSANSHFLPSHVFYQGPTMGLPPSCPEVIMYFLNSNFRKEIYTLIVPEKKHVKSVAMGSNHTIATFFAEFLHS